MSAAWAMCSGRARACWLDTVSGYMMRLQAGFCGSAPAGSTPLLGDDAFLLLP